MVYKVGQSVKIKETGQVGTIHKVGADGVPIQLMVITETGIPRIISAIGLVLEILSSVEEIKEDGRSLWGIVKILWRTVKSWFRAKP